MRHLPLLGRIRRTTSRKRRHTGITPGIEKRYKNFKMAARLQEGEKETEKVKKSTTIDDNNVEDAGKEEGKELGA